MFKRSKEGGKKRLDAKMRSLINVFVFLEMHEKTNKALFASQIKIKLMEEGLNGSL